MTKLLVVAALLCVLVSLPAQAQLPPECGTTLPLAEPYVFILLDISGSMDHSTLCSQAEHDAGQCGYVCAPSSGTQCHTPTQGDHPGSKWFQVRQALYNVLSGIDDVRFGFATFSDQDALRVIAKHWLYQATTAGPTIPTWGPYPAVGSQEVFGARWSCTAGASDGCSVSVPADLMSDPWEMTRMQRLPKGGELFNETVTFYLRRGSSTYRVRYAPVPGGTMGGPIQTTVTTVRCLDSSCSSTYPTGTQTVSWAPVSDFLSWESSTGAATRYQPFSYFNQTAASDATATGVCSATADASGWEPNGDDAEDTSVVYGVGYDLKQPTDATDPRGPFFALGDVIPLDWLQSHKQDVLARLAPNLVFDPLAAPDFRSAVYFQDHPAAGDPPFFLRLRDEEARPLVPFGRTGLSVSIRSFRGWFDGCTSCSTATGWYDVAALEDPEWACRRTHLLVITDSQEECQNGDPCDDVYTLKSQTGLTTSVIGIGLSPGNPLRCMALSTGGLESYPRTRQQIEQALTDFFDFVAQP